MTTEPIKYPPARPELRDYYHALTEVALTFPGTTADAIISHHSKCVTGTRFTKPTNATDDELRRATERFRQQATDILEARQQAA